MMRVGQNPLLLGFLCLIFSLLVSGQECSGSIHCATGCCSQYGFCGIGDDFCGKGCQSTCDYQTECSASNPCAPGSCCSKFGFCGLGPKYCAPDVCVGSCDTKAECDPGGYGAAYVNYTTCPLNVCCSKWGYCGTTKEFCGDQTVDRPACSPDTSSVRVVGYYEGWAARRPCQAFQPENVPLGVYTHLNFAFASIDPNTFEVVPADAGDVSLYSRLTALKQQDPALKVYIAIGGWTFNDPGPTATTFSNLAGSTSNQQKFFASLISFLNTYNFDGVDIDWEYPAAGDRSGRDQDYANFPIFIRNLKRALASSSGGRDGVTITLPVSYWYLQHFDITNLEPWVDWFNVMSYDLHGLWDKGNKWLGPFLNSHTNLTEITEYLDLLWRNNIAPQKVNMGLAFYSRTFMASDPACMSPGCTFDAVGDPGPCTHSPGTLSNAELSDKIKTAGATSTLQKDAAVQIANVGREWITYDDAASWQLKVNFARSECMGGVMVWAVSQDYTDGTFSKQLQSVTQYQSPTVAIFEEKDGSTVEGPDSKVLRNQCYWANCGTPCGSGYTAVPRKDSDAHKNEVMQDGSRCRGGQLRVFCCPSSQSIPSCGWFDFNNGKCGKKWQSVCPAGSTELIGPYTTEVGSMTIACNNGGAQVACCEAPGGPDHMSADVGYSQCIWTGSPPDCGDSSYHEGGYDNYCKNNYSPRSHFLTDSQSGSGGITCKTNGKTDSRAYCSDVSDPDQVWQQCSWVPGRQLDDGYVEPYCPDGTVRLAMQYAVGMFGDSGYGNGAFCCTPHFLTKAVGNEETGDAFVSALENIIGSPCSWSTTSVLSLRTAAPIANEDAAADVAVENVRPTTVPVLNRTREASSGQLNKRGGPSYDCQLAFADTFNMLGSNDADLVQVFEDGWNKAMDSKGYANMHASRIANEPTGVAFSMMDKPLQTLWVQGLLNTIPEISKDNDEEEVPVCPYFWNADPGLTEDVDDGGVDQGYVYTRRAISRSLDIDAEYLTPKWSNSASPITRLQKRGGAERRVALSEEMGKAASGRAEARNAVAVLRTRYAEMARNRTAAQPPPGAESDTGTQNRPGADTERRRRAEDAAILDLDEAEIRKGLLEERYQTGAERQFWVRSAFNPLWVAQDVVSSPYPNGNGGDDLLAMNGDTHRYLMASRGCGPQDYTLLTSASKIQSQHWVSEHILELQTIPRFLEAILDGQLYAVPSMSLNPIFITQVNSDIILKFTQHFPSWANQAGHSLTAADTALTISGSIAYTEGIVIADANLNSIKTKIYSFQRPIGDSWDECCSSATLADAEHAFSYIQTVMAVFDYYESPNVKSRHEWAFGGMKLVMADFERAYTTETGINIVGTMQHLWVYYMQAHMSRVVEFSQLWAGGRLSELSNIWYEEFLAAVASLDATRMLLALQILNLVDTYFAQINAGSKLTFDTSIFY